jgi:ABC-type lipoprotein release transport system permease subunit
MNADEFTIVGLLNTPAPGITKSGVYISFADAEDFLLLDGLRTELVVSMIRRVNLKDAMADSDRLAKAVEERWRRSGQKVLAK